MTARAGFEPQRADPSGPCPVAGGKATSSAWSSRHSGAHPQPLPLTVVVDRVRASPCHARACTRLHSHACAPPHAHPHPHTLDRTLTHPHRLDADPRSTQAWVAGQRRPSAVVLVVVDNAGGPTLGPSLGPALSGLGSCNLASYSRRQGPCNADHI